MEQSDGVAAESVSLRAQGHGSDLLRLKLGLELFCSRFRCVYVCGVNQTLNRRDELHINRPTDRDAAARVQFDPLQERKRKRQESDRKSIIIKFFHMKEIFVLRAERRFSSPQPTNQRRCEVTGDAASQI